MKSLFILSWVLLCSAEFKEEMEVYEDQCIGEDRHLCADGACIWRAQVCNHVVDCKDGSDESACLNYAPDPLLCNATHQFLCEDLRKCIPMTWICNEEVDCFDESDEKHCSALSNSNSTCKGFECDRDKCISNLWVCDGMYDCHDKSDETLEACRKSRHGVRRPLDDTMCVTEMGLGGAVRCADDSFCLPAALVCDGVVDCRDHTDEGPFCDKWPSMCTNSSCGLPARCDRQPTGPICICPSYDVYDNTTKSCRGAKMCERPRPVCAQMCIDQGGPYTCQCADGYHADSLGVGHVCSAPDPEGLLFFTTSDTIGYIKLKSREVVTLIADVKQGLSVAFDGKFVYWGESASGHYIIWRAQIENAAKTKQILVSVGLKGPPEFALDWLGNHIYLTDMYRNVISVCRTDAPMCTFLPTRLNDMPKKILVDPLNGTMYYSVFHRKRLELQGHMGLFYIMRARMDGTDQFILTSITSLHLHPPSLALDSPGRRLYFVVVRMYSWDIVGLHLDNQKLFVLESSPHPINAIAVFENTVYWLDEARQQLRGIDKIAGNPVVHFTPLPVDKNINGMFMYHPLLSTAKHNPCTHSRCSHICLFNSSTTYICECPEGLQLRADGFNCERKPHYRPQYLVIGGGNQLVRLQWDSLGPVDKNDGLKGVQWIQAMAYDNTRDLMYIYDGQKREIRSLNMSNFYEGTTEPFLDSGFIDVIDMDYDYWTNTLYILDAGRGTIDAVSVLSRQRAQVVKFTDETPFSICVLPSEGRILVAMASEPSEKGARIDSYSLDGSDRNYYITSNLKGPNIKISYVAKSQMVFVTDAGNHDVTYFRSYTSKKRTTYRQVATPITDVAATSDTVFWTGQGHTLYWGEEGEMNPAVHHMNFDIFPNNTHLHLQATTANPSLFDNEYFKHPCQSSPCTHVCVQLRSNSQEGKQSGLGYRCLCPPGLLHTKYSCAPPVKCASTHGHCHRSNTCFKLTDRCNGQKDCPEAEDEEGCNNNNTTPAPHICNIYEKLCKGICVKRDEHCPENVVECLPTEFRCPDEDNHCVQRGLVCDGHPDCTHGGDERTELCDALECLDTEYKCVYGPCVLKAFKCDGEDDCPDGSDEAQCDKITCSLDHFKCLTGQCIDRSLRCNSAVDCADGSDEDGCAEPEDDVEEDPVECAEWEFACELNRSMCFPFTARCNHRSDCPLGTDEADCFGNSCLGQGAMTCKIDGKCVWPRNWCDGRKDCTDGSDETPDACAQVNRTSRFYPSVRYPSEECDHGFLCDNGQCVEWRAVCDHAPDCFDGSDENGLCLRACEHNNCTFHCQPTPRGQYCVCPDGYRQNQYGVCEDIDECAKDICAHDCFNTDGGYMCFCHRGYALRSDRHSCKSTSGQLMLVYGSGGAVRSLAADGQGALHYWGTAEVAGIDLDFKRNNLYIAIEEEGKLVEMHDTVAINVTNIGRPRKVAVDWVSGNVYYASEEYVGVCHFGRRRCAKLLRLPPTALVQSLAVDPSAHMMFYCVSLPGAPGAVWSATAVGRKARDLTPAQCRGLSLDTYSRKLFVAEDEPSRLLRMDYGGRDVKELISNSANFHLTKDLAIFEDKAYFLMPHKYKVNRCTLYGRKRSCEVYHQGILAPSTFVLRHQSIQRDDLTDSCADFPCDNVCVIIEEGPVCVCHMGGYSDKDGRCPAFPEEEMAQFHGGPPSAPFSTGSSILGALIGILLLVLLIIAAFGALYYRYCGRRRNVPEPPVYFLAVPAVTSIGQDTIVQEPSSGQGTPCGSGDASTTSSGAPLKSPSSSDRGIQLNPFNFNILPNFLRSSKRRKWPIQRAVPIVTVESPAAQEDLSDTESATDVDLNPEKKYKY